MSAMTSVRGAGRLTGADFTDTVLSAAPGRQGRDVPRDYRPMEWVRGTPTATAMTHDGRVITTGDPSLPEAPGAGWAAFSSTPGPGGFSHAKR